MTAAGSVSRRLSAEHGEEIRRYHGLLDERFLPVRRHRLPFHDDVEAIEVAEDRDGRGECGAVHAGEGGEAFQELALESPQLVGRAIVLFGEGDGARPHAGGVPAGVALQQVVEAADEETGAGEESQGEGDLADHERVF